MKLIIASQPIHVNAPKDSYTVAIELMRGDGDGYTTITMGPFKRNEHEASLYCLLETLQRMKARYPNGRRGGNTDAYDGVLGFVQWFGEVGSVEDLKKWHPQLLTSYSEKEHQEIIDAIEVGEFYGEWYSHDDTQDSLTAYEVYYYDDDSSKYAVQVF